jgi:hypothetical protein
MYTQLKQLTVTTLVISFGLGLQAADAPTKPVAPLPEARIAELSKLLNDMQEAKDAYQERLATFNAALAKAGAELGWPTGAGVSRHWDCLTQIAPGRVGPCMVQVPVTVDVPPVTPSAKKETK